ncbi:hypothetical protein B4U80_05354 [Leptotrombidium deliense]|uniref:Uncharacterized protein n=1 Tax=Leptotrombidium deliense TaxID=299467 RepID=A0A443SBV1_9ACAR|nr:hypothetical protein B4U80_05354 [Leptotrombidium deliense]
MCVNVEYILQKNFRIKHQLLPPRANNDWRIRYITHSAKDTLAIACQALRQLFREAKKVTSYLTLKKYSKYLINKMHIGTAIFYSPNLKFFYLIIKNRNN